jgi:hypothetical protein
MARVLSLFALAAALIPATQAQDLEQTTEFLMVNQHVCAPSRMSEVTEMFDQYVAPVMHELQSQELIGGYGRIVHAWGDEWNFGFWFTTEDHASFVVAWNAFASRMFERHPTQMESFLEMCTMHKDNLYSMTTYAAAGG